MQLLGPQSEEALQQLPPSLRTLTVLERRYLYKPGSFYNTALDSTFDKRYLPHNSVVFELPCYWVQRRHLYVHSCHQSCLEALGWYVGSDFDDDVLFPIHPLSLTQYDKFLTTCGARNARADGLRILALPTASVRTVLAWPDRAPELAVYVKLSLLPTPILGDRRIWGPKGASCVGLTKLLEASSVELPHGLGYMHEPLALVPRTKPDGGVVIRRIPQELKDSSVVVAPLFSLFGGEQKCHPLLLTVAAQSGLTPLQFVENTLCRKFAGIWIATAFSVGLFPECHGQNLLLALSPSLASLDRFYYRDFHGLLVDWGFRRSRGLSAPAKLPCDFLWRDSYVSLYFGAPPSEQISWKIMISLHAYTHFVLKELTACMQHWGKAGLFACPPIHSGYLIDRFSQTLIEASEDIVRERAGELLNFGDNPNRYCRYLMTVRSHVMGVSHTPAA